MAEATMERIETILREHRKGTEEEVKKALQEEIKKQLQTMEQAHEEKIKGVKSQFEETLEQLKAMDQQIRRLMKSNFASIKTPEGRYNGVWGDLQTAKNFGLYVLAEVMGNKSAKKAIDELGIKPRVLTPDGEVKELNTTDPTAGAVLAPSEFVPQLMVLIESYSKYRQLSQVVPMGAGDSTIPVQTSDVTVYCPGAGVSPTASDLGFKTIGLNPLEWLAYVAVNNDLQEDAAIAVGELVGRSLARAFGKKEDDCGFVGDGTKTYFNITGATTALRAVDATVTNVKGLKVQDTAGAWSAIDLQDILAVIGLLASDYETGEEAMVCNKNFYLTVMVNAALGAGGSNAQEVIQTAFTTQPRFLGHTVALTGAMPKVKAAADHCPLLYGNFKMGSVVGDRRQFRVATSDQVKFLERQTVIMGSERIAIVNHGVGDTTNTGPIVGFWADIA